MRIPRSLLVLVLAALLLPWPGSTSMASEEVEIAVDIQISPKTIVLFATRTGNWVTVHADIPYVDVDLESPLTLNAVEAEFAKPDDYGDLVAKVRLTELRGELEPGLNVLLFEGHTTDGTPFAGSGTVFVRERKAKKE